MSLKRRPLFTIRKIREIPGTHFRYRLSRPHCQGTSSDLIGNGTHIKQNKLRDLQSACELYRLGDRQLSTKFSANFRG
jgi:hypothetical protein